MRTRIQDRFIGFLFLTTIITLSGCGIGSTSHTYTPTSGAAYIPANDGTYGPSTAADGDGWADGFYSQGYGGAGQDGFCLGAACFCPTGWSSETFEASMLITDSSESGVLSTSGKASLIMENSVHVNSTSSSSVSAGSNSRLAASKFYLVGNYSGTPEGEVFLEQSPLPDPLMFLPVPDSSQLTVQSNSHLVISSVGTLQPGIYDGGISTSSKEAQVTLEPGLYYFVNGGLTIGAQSNVTGIEVTLYFADSSGGSLTIEGGGSAELTPPQDGYTKGLTIFFNRNNNSTVMITGGGNLQIYGSIYAKNTSVVLGGNGNMVAGSQIVANNVSIGGNGSAAITTANGLYALPSGCFAP